jgi:hypothetical protein
MLGVYKPISHLRRLDDTDGEVIGTVTVSRLPFKDSSSEKRLLINDVDHKNRHRHRLLFLQDRLDLGDAEILVVL